MVVEIEIACLAAFSIPFEYQSPLLVYPDGVPPGEMARELLEVVAWGYPQIGIRSGIVHQLELPEKALLEVCGDLSGTLILDEERLEPVVTKTLDHELLYRSTVHISSPDIDRTITNHGTPSCKTAMAQTE